MILQFMLHYGLLQIHEKLHSIADVSLRNHRPIPKPNEIVF